ncbi:MAG: hypothetical protein ABFD69_10525 [Candidatus Sumerlaeia bacterium]
MRDDLPARHRISFITLNMIALSMLVACYEPDPIESLTVSRDGRWVASVTHDGELNVLDLQKPGAPFTRISNHVSGPVAWSPDSQRVALVEQYPNRPSALWLVSPRAERAQTPLLTDISFKADPAVLNDGRIVLRSDHDEDRVGIWTLDPVSHRREKFLAAVDADIGRLWTAPAGDSLAYQSAGPEGVDLWWWKPGSPPLRLTRNQRRENPANQAVAFAPDGGGVAFVARGERGPQVAWFDLQTKTVANRIPLPSWANGIAVLGDGRVAVACGAELRLWRPEKTFFERELGVARFEDLPLSLPQANNGGVTLAVNRVLMLNSPSAGRLGRGAIQSDGVEDILMLARARAEAGRFDSARATLERVWAKTPEITKKYLIAVARARLERAQQRWSDSRQWLGRAVELAASGSPEQSAAELERLAVGAFDQRSTALASDLLHKLHEPAASHELAQWLAAGLADPQLKRWLAIGGDVRSGRDEAAAIGLETLAREDTWTTHSLTGLRLLLDGEFEPLLMAAQQHQTERLNRLLSQPAVQAALMRALESKNDGGPSRDELSQTILTQMVRRGDLAGAKRFVSADLARPEPLNGYPSMLAQFLGLDETDPVVYQVVADVLLADGIAGRLDLRLTDPREKLLLRMAQVKAALIAERTEPAAAWLRDCQSILGRIPVDETGDNIRDLARQLLLLDVFDAKLAEERGRWDAALTAYRRSLRLAGRFPNEWDALTYEITAAIGLIEAGKADPELLASFERLLRGMGDPLINPSRQPASLLTALDNLDLLERTAAEAWIKPWFAYVRGLCYSQLDWPAQALYHLRTARRSGPAPALMQRILLEEAAVRDGLGQHALAARLQGRLSELDVPEPLRAGALLAQVQAEAASGSTIAPLDRVARLMDARKLDPRWRRWLWMQFGGDAAQ